MGMYPYDTLAMFYHKVLKVGLLDVWFKLFLVWLDVGVYSNRFGLYVNSTV